MPPYNYTTSTANGSVNWWRSQPIYTYTGTDSVLMRDDVFPPVYRNPCDCRVESVNIAGQWHHVTVLECVYCMNQREKREELEVIDSLLMMEVKR